MITLSIYLETPSRKWKKAFKEMPEKIEQAVTVAFLYAKKPKAFSNRNFELSVILADDKAMTDLNHTYRGKKSATNVLSFPQFKMKGLTDKVLDFYPDQDAVPLGDIVIAQETVAKECRQQGKALEDHTIHLVVHGTLHLLGYDHMKGAEAKTMEKLECEVLDALGYADPYADQKRPVKPKAKAKAKTPARPKARAAAKKPAKPQPKRRRS